MTDELDKEVEKIMNDDNYEPEYHSNDTNYNLQSFKDFDKEFNEYVE